MSPASAGPAAMTVWTCLPNPLRAGDAALAAALGLACALAARGAGPADESAESVLLAGRRAPWWAAGLALMAAEVSGLTLIAAPAAAYAGGWGLAQVFAGSLLGRLGSAWLCPRQRQTGALTVYGAAKPWAGPAAPAAAAVFCAARALSSALRLLAAAVALSLLSGLGPGWWALLLCLAGAAIAGYGGLRAVLWTAPVQVAAVLLAAAALPVYTLGQVPGTIHGVLTAAGAAGRLAFGDAGPAWRAWLLGALGALAGFSADHELAQKLLCCRSDRDARRALALSAAGAALLLGLLLSAGTCLFAFYGAHPALAVPGRLDLILPHFAATVLPAPLRGLTLAAVALAGVDLPLSSLSAVSWADLAGGGERLPAGTRWALAAGWSAALLGLALWMLSSQRAAALGAAAWPAVAGALLVLAAGAALRRPRPGALAVAVGAALAAGLAAASLAAVRPAFDRGWPVAAGAAAGAAVLWGLDRRGGGRAA